MGFESPQDRRKRLQKAAKDHRKTIAGVSVDPEEQPAESEAKKPAKKKAAAKK